MHTSFIYKNVVNYFIVKYFDIQSIRHKYPLCQVQIVDFYCSFLDAINYYINSQTSRSDRFVYKLVNTTYNCGRIPVIANHFRNS